MKLLGAKILAESLSKAQQVANAFETCNTEIGITIARCNTDRGKDTRAFIELLIEALELYFQDEDNYFFGAIDAHRIEGVSRQALMMLSEEDPKEAVSLCLKLADLLDQNVEAEQSLVRLANSLAQGRVPEKLQEIYLRLEKFDYHCDDIELREKIIELVEADGSIDIERRIIVANHRLLRGDIRAAKVHLNPVKDLVPERVAYQMVQIFLLGGEREQATCWLAKIPEDQLSYRELWELAKLLASSGGGKLALEHYERALTDLEHLYNEMEH